MSDPTQEIDHPPIEDVEALNEFLATELGHLSPRQLALLLMMSSAKHHYESDDPAGDLMDYRIAAERILSAVEPRE